MGIRAAVRELYDLLSGRAMRGFDQKLAEDSATRDARRAVQMTARGNIAIIEGCFVTAEDLDEERREMSVLTGMIEEDRRHRARYGYDPD